MKKNKNIPLNLKEQINSRIGLICSIVVMLLLVLVFHQLDYQLIQKPADQAAKEAAKQKEEAEAAAKAPEISTATVVAVGDNLFHDSLIESGKSDSGTWNYDKIYENVKDEIQAADIAMVDQETVFTTDHDAVSGYPSFATPTEVGDALVNAGFDVIESATPAWGSRPSQAVPQRSSPQQRAAPRRTVQRAEKRRHCLRASVYRRRRPWKGTMLRSATSSTQSG